MSESDDALARARKHARTIGRHLTEAIEAHASGDHDLVARHLRSAQQAHVWLGSAHAALDEAIGTGHDPTANPTAAQGAQTSDGKEPRHASGAVVVERLLTSFRAGAREVKR